MTKGGRMKKNLLDFGKICDLSGVIISLFKAFFSKNLIFKNIGKIEKTEPVL